MASHGRDSSRGVVRSLAKEVQKELGVLAVPLQQCAVDCLGPARCGVCAHLTATVSRFPEHQGNDKEPRAVGRAVSEASVAVKEGSGSRAARRR